MRDHITSGSGSAAAAATAFALALATLAHGGSAHAQFDPLDGRTGLCITARGGYGAVTSQTPFAGTTYSNSDGSFTFNAEAGYRIVPLLSVGLHGGYQILPPHGTGFLSSSGGVGMLGAHLRIHPLGLIPSLPILDRIDLHVGVGFDPYVSGWQTTQLFADVNAHASWSAVGVPITVGLDLYLLGPLGLSVLGGYSPWWATSSCIESSCSSPSGNTQIGYWFLTAGLSLRFNVLHH